MPWTASERSSCVVVVGALKTYRVCHTHLGEGLLHLDAAVAIHLGEDGDAGVGQALLARHAGELVDAPRLLAVAELVQVRVGLLALVKALDHEVVHVVPPLQHVAPPRQPVPVVRQPHAPHLRRTE
eukprot:5043770-Pyramimonas_sp.AAC.1